MWLILRWLARSALLLHLFFVHFALFRLWYGSGLRKVFTKKENVHIGDLLAAVSLAEHAADSTALPPREAASDGRGRVALLFMLKRNLEHADAWRLWLEDPGRRDTRGGQPPDVSLYFHVAELTEGARANADMAEQMALLRSLPGFRRIVPTVRTGWCELMAAEVALYRAALEDDPSAQMFVLLPHDSVPFAPLAATLDSLLGSRRGAPARAVSRICPAGVRGLDVPSACPHGIEPHWSRTLLLKHHQWMALSREHAKRMTDGRAMRVAISFFQEWYLGEPLCSDEVLPLLALALPAELAGSSELGWGFGQDHAAQPQIQDLPLYAGAAQGLAAFEAGLQDAGMSSECVLYAPWPGCHLRPMGEGKRTKSPVEGGGLSPSERDGLIRWLGSQGILFGRKLGVGGGTAVSHQALISEQQERGSPRAPHRLLPQPVLPAPSWFAAAVDAALAAPIVLRWGLSLLEATGPWTVQVPVAVILAAAFGWAAQMGGGIGQENLRRLLGAAVAAYLMVFFLSVALFAEYSLLEPFRGSAMLSKPEI